MSSDVMIICKESGTHFEGDNSDVAIFIDEASMGDPLSEFGKWLVNYVWSIRHKRLDGYDINKMILAVKKKDKHEGFSKKSSIKI